MIESTATHQESDDDDDDGDRTAQRVSVANRDPSRASLPEFPLLFSAYSKPTFAGP